MLCGENNMKREEFISKIWSYYIMLEKHFETTFQYVEPIEDNNLCFSKEFNKQLLSIGSEIDIVCKELCMVIENKNFDEVKKYNIADYKKIISNDNNFMEEKCIFLVNQEILKPWADWENLDSPNWWKDYNNIKHNRLINNNHKLGNYSNVKIALAALFVIIRILYKKQFSAEPMPQSNLFKMNNWSTYKEIGNGFFTVISPNGNVGLKKLM